jgi:hypothetical protein
MADSLFEQAPIDPIESSRCWRSGTKKNHFNETDRIHGQAHRSCGERKARRAAEGAINAFVTPVGLVRGFIPHVHQITGIPEMILRR